MLNRDSVRAAKDHKRQWVAMPEWVPDGEEFNPDVHGLYVGSMSARDKDGFERAFLEKDGRDNARAKLAVLTCQDADGKRIFEDGDADWLGQKNAGPLSRIFDVAIKINRLSKDDQAELVKSF
jgi:hypothetical protein